MIMEMPPCGGIFIHSKGFWLKGGTYRFAGCAGVTGANGDAVGGAIAVTVMESAVFHVASHSLQVLSRFFG